MHAGSEGWRLDLARGCGSRLPCWMAASAAKSLQHRDESAIGQGCALRIVDRRRDSGEDSGAADRNTCAGAAAAGDEGEEGRVGEREMPKGLGGGRRQGREQEQW